MEKNPETMDVKVIVINHWWDKNGGKNSEIMDVKRLQWLIWPLPGKGKGLGV